MSTLKTKNLQHPDSADALLLNATGGLSVPGALVSSVTGGGGSISGDRNRVINGSCQIVNVATFVASNNTNGFGGPEMFFAQNAPAAGGQFTQSQGSLTFQGLSLPTVRQTVNTAITSTATGNYWHGINTAIEGFNAFDLRGKPIVVSFVFNTNVTGIYSVALRDGTNSQSYVTTILATANTPVEVKLPIPTIPTAANIPNSNVGGMSITVGFLNTGTFQTSTLNAWQSGNFISATGATNWGATAGNFIELTRLQLEEGTVATPFVWRSYGQELALTQRYAFYQRASVINECFSTGFANNTTTTAQHIFLPVQMRAIPTLTTSAANTFQVSDGTTATATTNISLAGGQSSGQAIVLAVSSTGLTAFRPYRFEAAGTTLAFINLSARL